MAQRHEKGNISKIVAINAEIDKAHKTGDPISSFFAQVSVLAGGISMILERSRQTHAQARHRLTEFDPPATSDNTEESEPPTQI